MKTGKMFFGLILLASIFTAGNAKAKTPLDIKINNKILKTETRSFIDDSHSMVPLRDVSEALGCDKIEWNNKTKKATVVNDDDTLDIYIGKRDAKINGEIKTMPTTAKMVDERTYVSVRTLSDFFDTDVLWNELTHTVEIKKQGHEIQSEHIDNSYTSDDLDWLAKIVHAEAGGEPDLGKIAVGNVVMNRVKSSEFPDNVYDVVFDRKFGVQFTPVANGTIYNNPTKQSYHAAKKALFGKKVVGNSLYFCNLSISTNLWIPNNRPFFTKIGKHSFYL